MMTFFRHIKDALYETGSHDILFETAPIQNPQYRGFSIP